MLKRTCLDGRTMDIFTSGFRHSKKTLLGPSGHAPKQVVRVTNVPGRESALAPSVENLRPLDGNDVMASLSAPLVITCDAVACDSVIHALTHALRHSKEFPPAWSNKRWTRLYDPYTQNVGYHYPRASWRFFHKHQKVQLFFQRRSSLSETNWIALNALLFHSNS